MTDKPKTKLTKAEAGRIGGKIGGKISKGGGRPKGSSKYATEEERLEAKRESVRRYRAKKKHSG